MSDSVQTFKDRRAIRNIGDLDGIVTEEWLKRACNKPIVSYEKVWDIDNTDKYEWVIIGTLISSNRSYIDSKYRDEKLYLYQKYGRTMYCLKTGIRRFMTMGEWFGTGIVD